MAQRSATIHDRGSIDERPEKLHCGIVTIQFQKLLGVRAKRFDLSAMSNDAGIREQANNVFVTHPDQQLGTKREERAAHMPALPQHRDPTQSGLESFQHQEFEQFTAVARRYAPFAIVIADV